MLSVGPETMASNKSYSLTGDLMELKSCDKNKKQSKGIKLGDIEPIYLNTTQSKGNDKRDAAEDDYEILQTVETNDDTSVETDISKRKVNQRREKRLVPALLRMVVVLFVLFGAVAGICVWLAIKISKEQSTSHFHKELKGEWSNWESWNQCSVPCGYGTTYRKRTFNNTDERTLSLNCKGDSEEHTICKIDTCTGHRPFKGERLRSMQYHSHAVYPDRPDSVSQCQTRKRKMACDKPCLTF